MNSLPSFKILSLKGRDSDTLSLQSGQGGIQASEVLIIRHNHDITITAKLRRAVKHAGLTSHKQVLNLVA